MNDSQNLCLTCGMCCDGTLIGFVHLDQEELPELKKIMEIEEGTDDGFFLQPCQNYCNGCTIYPQRPKQCDNFKCGLLKSFNKREINFDTATDIINVVKQKKLS